MVPRVFWTGAGSHEAVGHGQQPKAACRRHAVLGTAIGAGVGAATAAGVLAATGGSDSTFKVLFTFTGVGAVGGLVIASSVCRK